MRAGSLLLRRRLHTSSQSSRRRSMRTWLWLPCALALVATTHGEAAVDDNGLPVLDLPGVQHRMMAHSKLVLLLHHTGCERAESFAPTVSIRRAYTGPNYGHTGPRMAALGRIHRVFTTHTARACACGCMPRLWRSHLAPRLAPRSYPPWLRRCHRSRTRVST